MASKGTKHSFASVRDFQQVGKIGAKSSSAARNSASKNASQNHLTAAKPLLQLSDDDEDDDGDAADRASDSDSDEPGSGDWIQALQRSGSAKKPANNTPFKALQPRRKTEDIADSDAERKADKQAKLATKTKSNAQPANTTPLVRKVRAASSTSESSSEVETSSGSSSGSDSDSDSDVVNGKQAKAKPANGASQVPAKLKFPQTQKNVTSAAAAAASDTTSSDSTSSPSSETESSSGSESDAPQVKRASAKPLVNGNRKSTPQRATSSQLGLDTSSEDSDDESDEEESPSDKNTKPVSTRQNGKAPASNTSSSASDEVRPASESEDSDEEMADESVAITQGRTGNRAPVPEMLSKDFIARRADDDEDVKDIANVFREARLAGKQIWYFTVPESVPVQVIEDMAIPLDKINTEEPVFSHDNKDYIVSDNPLLKDSLSLMVNYNGQDYTKVPHAIDKVLHFKRFTQMPVGPQMTEITVQMRHAARPQPEGLKQRFKPIGIATSPVQPPTPVDSSDDVEMGNTSSKVPAASTGTSQRDVFDGEEPALSTRDMSKDKKKKKKDRWEKMVEADAVIPASTYEIEDESAHDVNGIEATLVSKKHKKDKDKRKRRDKPEDQVVAPPPVVEEVAKGVAEPRDEEKTPRPKGSKKRHRRRDSNATSASGLSVESDSQLALPSLLQMTVSPAASAMKSKRKHSSEEDGEGAAAQLVNESLSAERKLKKTRFANPPRFDPSNLPGPKKVTPIPVPTIGRLSNAPSSSPVPTSAPSQPATSSVKVTPVVPPYVPHHSPAKAPKSSAVDAPAAAAAAAAAEARNRDLLDELPADAAAEDEPATPGARRRGLERELAKLDKQERKERKRLKKERRVAEEERAQQTRIAPPAVPPPRRGATETPIPVPQLGGRK